MTGGCIAGGGVEPLRGRGCIARGGVEPMRGIGRVWERSRIGIRGSGNELLLSQAEWPAELRATWESVPVRLENGTGGPRWCFVELVLDYKTSRN
jgi:hypothetical protein